MKKNNLLYFLLLISLLSCKDNEVNDIYKKAVYLEVDITTSDYGLANSGSTKEILKPRKAIETVGYGGILLYRASVQVDGYPGIMGLYAFDLACPIENIATQKVHAIGNDKAKCDRCGTVYDLTFGLGNPVDGKGKLNLVRYRVYYVPGDHVLFKVINN